MSYRMQSFLVICLAWAAIAARYPTPEGNFLVIAPNMQVARMVGEKAEIYRRTKAIEWLGEEMPPWGQRCPLKVTITPGGSGGATTFVFSDRDSSILSQEMQVEGTLERVLNSVLPHEITHTVFAYYFREPLPRWADEGGCVLSEDAIERERHDKLVRQILAGRQYGQAFNLRALFSMREYPSEVMKLYAQGYSVAEFLVESKDRKTFLEFVRDGMRNGWDSASRTHYGMRDLGDLEGQWLDWLRTGHQVAKNNEPSRDEYRREPRGGLSIFRGQSPSEDHDLSRTRLGRPTSRTPGDNVWRPAGRPRR